MSLEATLFTAGNFAVLPAWLLLAAAPRWRGSQVVAAMVAPALLIVAYGALAIPALLGDPTGDLFSLAGLSKAFANPRVLLAGWYHYLALDLFAGAWIARDGQRLQMPRAVVTPCLGLTLFLAPLGLGAYLALRLIMRKGEAIDALMAEPPDDLSGRRSFSGDNTSSASDK